MLSLCVSLDVIIRTYYLPAAILDFVGDANRIASALCVVDWAALREEDLIHVFQATRSESKPGSGPTVSAISHDLLPNADASSAQLVLPALMSALPLTNQINDVFAIDCLG